MNIQNIPKELKKLKQWCCWAGDTLQKQVDKLLNRSEKEFRGGTG